MQQKISQEKENYNIKSSQMNYSNKGNANEKSSKQKSQNDDEQFSQQKSITNKDKIDNSSKRNLIQPETENPKKVAPQILKASQIKIAKNELNNLSEKDLEKLLILLPTGENEEDEKQRMKLWKKCDSNGNGKVSLSEIESTLDAMGEEMRHVAHQKQALKAAYQVAKQYGEGKHTAELLKKQFHDFVIYLNQYMKYYVWFLKIDTSGDGKLNLEEFKKAEKIIESHWNEDINCEQVFKEIDVNNGGSILFTEFAHFCIEKSLKLQKEKQQPPQELIPQIEKKTTQKDLKPVNTPQKEKDVQLKSQQENPKVLQPVKHISPEQLKINEFIDQFIIFFNFSYATSQLIAHEQLSKFSGQNREELGILIVRILPFLGENLYDNFAKNLEYINDKQLLRFSLNFTSQFKNFKEITVFVKCIAEKISKELKKEIINIKEDSPYLVDWMDKIQKLSQQINLKILMIEGVDVFFNTPIKQYANKICCYLIGNWISSGRLREQYLFENEEKIKFFEKIIGNGRYKEKFQMLKHEEVEKQENEQKQQKQQELDRKLQDQAKIEIKQNDASDDKQIIQNKDAMEETQRKILPSQQIEDGGCCLIF